MVCHVIFCIIWGLDHHWFPGVPGITSFRQGWEILREGQKTIWKRVRRARYWRGLVSNTLNRGIVCRDKWAWHLCRGEVLPNGFCRLAVSGGEKIWWGHNSVLNPLDHRKHSPLYNLLLRLSLPGLGTMTKGLPRFTVVQWGQNLWLGCRHQLWRALQPRW